MDDSLKKYLKRDFIHKGLGLGLELRHQGLGLGLEWDGLDYNIAICIGFAFR